MSLPSGGRCYNLQEHFHAQIFQIHRLLRYMHFQIQIEFFPILLRQF